MAHLPLADRYADRLVGTLACFDRLLLFGSLPTVSQEAGLASFLRNEDIPLSDFADFASSLRDRLCQHLEDLAQSEGVEIEFITSPNRFRKEERIQAIITDRGDHPGIVHIFTVMEPCQAFTVIANSGRPYLRLRLGKCKHYYIYFIDPEFGLCHLRIPTWLPFRLQFYCNGHSWLARELQRQGIGFVQDDNAFRHIDDWQRAQQLADHFPERELHQALDELARRFCPVAAKLQPTYHWSIGQAEFSTDLVFAQPQLLHPLYDALTHTAIHAIKATDVATFFGQPLPQDAEGGGNLRVQIEGTRIRHQIGPQAAIKMYDKHGYILRIETTVNDVSFFKHHREVVHRDHTTTMKLASMRKTLYSLPILAHILAACNRRYLTFLAELADPTASTEELAHLATPARAHDRTYRGFNLFAAADLEFFQALARGEWTIRGFANAALRRLLPSLTCAQVSRYLKRLQAHGLIERFHRSYRYRLTVSGQRLVFTGLKLRELAVIPTLMALQPGPA